MGRIDGIFRFKLPKLFPLSPQLLPFLFLATSVVDLPKTSSLGYLLDFLSLKLFCSNFSFVFLIVGTLSLPFFQEKSNVLSF